MDTQKDIDKGHKDSPKNTGEIKPFKGLASANQARDDGEMSFIQSKTEKLATAIYMLTDFFDAKEPLKWRMRDTAVDIMSFINALAGGSFSNRHSGMNAHLPVFKTIKDMISLLDFSSRISLISEMNASMLHREYASIYRNVEARLQKGDPVGAVLLPERFFDDISRESRKKQTYIPANSSAKAGLVSAQGSHVPNPVPVGGTETSEERLPAAYASLESPVGERHRSGSGYNPRRDVILNLLRTKQEADIKDITNVVSNCSEKTVQRELIALVGEGLVKKLGERRWSKYALVEKGS